MTSIIVAYLVTGMAGVAWPASQAVRRSIACGSTPWVAITSGVGVVLLWPLVIWTVWRGR